MSNDAFESLIIKKKKKNQRTNDDLRKVNNRDNLERTYKQNNSKVTKAIAIVGTTAGVLGSLSAISKNAPSLLTNGKKAVSKAVISGNILYNIKKTKL